jgi:hypothetical protein
MSRGRIEEDIILFYFRTVELFDNADPVVVNARALFGANLLTARH